MCHVAHLNREQKDLLYAMSTKDRAQLNRILEDGGIPSRAKAVRAVFERYVENKHLTAIEAEAVSDLALSA